MTKKSAYLEMFGTNSKLYIGEAHTPRGRVSQALLYFNANNQ